MTCVIIESPYAGDVERNVAYAKRCILDCLNRGESPIASHLLFTQPGILNDDIPEERQKGISAGTAWIEKADIIVFYFDYGWSSGMNTTKQYAETYYPNTPREYRSIGLNPSDKTTDICSYCGETGHSTILCSKAFPRLPENDPVNHPKHYTNHPSGVECIQITRHMNFNLGNAIKYIWRAGEKDAAKTIEDLQKAQWYLDDEINRLLEKSK